MLVKDVMTKRVVTVLPEDSFARIVKLLIKKKISGVVVVNKKGKVVGVISEKDLLYNSVQEIHGFQPVDELNSDMSSSLRKPRPLGRGGRHKLFPSQKAFYKNLKYYMNYDNVFRDAAKITKLKAKNLMTKKIISINSGDDILKACSLFLIHNIRRLPVIDNGRLVGIVSTNNIYKNFLGTFVK